ncbi:response regulator [Microvirga aerilata]|nr:response regulator [Microvirga aerilata]
MAAQPILQCLGGAAYRLGPGGTVSAKVRFRTMKPPRRILNQPVVLLVEDDFLVRQTLVDMLREAQFWIVEAQDADEAFDLLRSRSDINIVLTDVNMPGSIDGFEFARLVRQGWPEVGVLVISGQAYPGHGNLAPNTIFLRKPVRSVALIKALRKAMAPD